MIAGDTWEPTHADRVLINKEGIIEAVDRPLGVNSVHYFEGRQQRWRDGRVQQQHVW